MSPVRTVVPCKWHSNVAKKSTFPRVLEKERDRYSKQELKAWAAPVQKVSSSISSCGKITG
jgi:hypothetical protein